MKLTAHEWADSLEKINREGARLAREAATGELAFVAGSIGPLGALVKPYGSLTLAQVREIFEEQARVLLEAGVDLVVLETFGSLLEAAEAVRAVRGLSAEIPIVAQMTFLADGRTAFGESAAHALPTLAPRGRRRRRAELHARAAGDPRGLRAPPRDDRGAALRDAERRLSDRRRTDATSISPPPTTCASTRGRSPTPARPSSAAAAARRPSTSARWRARSPAASARSRPASRSVAGARRRVRAEPAVETSRLKRLARGSRRVRRDLGGRAAARASTPPAAIDGARQARAAGVDAVNVTDNPMARLRMSSIAVAALIQRETGLEAVVQITTRDRNVLGLQSDLLGAAGLGLKAMLCLGGDPLKIGDYPQAQAGLRGGRPRTPADRPRA